MEGSNADDKERQPDKDWQLNGSIMNEKEYIQILIDSLYEKVEVLRSLQEKNKEQEAIFLDPATTPDELQENMDAKSKLIDRLDELDTGFEMLFKHVKDELDQNREAHKDEIRIMQKLITQITELIADVETAEHKNKELAKAKFAGIRSRIKEVHQGAKVVNNYYRGMMGVGEVEPQFMDKKH